MDSFFGIGPLELILVVVLALILLGPDRLPGAMRDGAKYMRQFQLWFGQIQSQYSEELKMLDDINPKRMINEMLDPNQLLKPLPPSAQVSPSSPPAPPVNAEPSNTILPPSPAAAPAGSAPGAVSSPEQQPLSAPDQAAEDAQ